MRPVRKRETDFVVVHCSATPASRDIGAADIDTMHKARGWQGIGYHFVIRRNGRIETGEDLARMGAHCREVNDRSVGICMVGGTDSKLKAENNFTAAQFESLAYLLPMLERVYPGVKFRGHRDFSEDRNLDGVITSDEFMKMCPCFDVDQFLRLDDPADGVNLPLHGDTLPADSAEEIELGPVAECEALDD